MERQVERRKRIGHGYVSTGRLPPPEMVKALVSEGYEHFKSNAEGRNSDVYPALARVPSDLFGVCVVGTNGDVHAAEELP
jgi:glutaminase